MLLFFLLGCTDSPDSVKSLSEGSLSILTYNIHGLPSEVTGDDTPGRIAQIATRLDTFDMVGLQEDWMTTNHERYIDQTAFVSQDYFDELYNDQKVYGAGLSLLSNLDFNNVQHFHYANCYGYTSNASDCFASKGLQMVEVALDNDKSLHVYNTHLEAGGGAEDHAVRSAQIAFIIDTINTLSATHPVIIMGDFNLRFSDAVDAPLLNDLMALGNLRHSCLEIDCPEADHIDQIFIRDSDNIQLRVENWSNQSTAFLDAEGYDLSDHPPISISLFWKSTQ